MADGDGVRNLEGGRRGSVTDENAVDGGEAVAGGMEGHFGLGEG